jgi:hypothetical protein
VTRDSTLHSVFDDEQIDQISGEDLAGDYPAISTPGVVSRCVRP